MNTSPLAGEVGEGNARTGWGVWLIFLVLLALLPLVGHGCHGDDEDHEPTVMPPVYNQR